MEKLKKFCPRCGSEKIKSSRMIFDNVVANFTQYDCSSCGWKGIPFEGDEKLISEFKKKFKVK